MKRGGSAGFLVVSVGLAFPWVTLTCAQPTVQPAPVPAASTPKPAVTVSASTPSAKPAASTAVPASASASAPVPLPASSATTTPGRVQCITTSCDTSKEICCATEGQGRCIPKAGASAARPCAEGEAERHCDEAADCTSGDHCCQVFDHNDSCDLTERWQCSKVRCGSTADSTWELCLLGSTCASGACKRKTGDESVASQGYCPLQTHGLSCGNATCGAGEACCWDAKARKGKCTSNGTCGEGSSPQAVSRLFACQHPNNCDGRFTCVNSTGSSSNEEYTCQDIKCHSMTLFLGPYVCDKAKDCPPRIWIGNPPPAEYRLKGCVHRPDDPPGVKTCEYK